MKIHQHTTGMLSGLQKLQLQQMWNREYPALIIHNTFTDFDAFLEQLTNPQHLLLLGEQEQLCAWFASFDRDGQRWFMMLVDGAFQGLGLGTRLLTEAKKTHPELYGWVVVATRYHRNDGTLYRSPLGFYLKNGFVAHPDIVSKAKGLETILVRWTRS